VVFLAWMAKKEAPQHYPENPALGDSPLGCTLLPPLGI